MSWFSDDKKDDSGGGIWDRITSSVPQAALSIFGGVAGTLGGLAADAFGGDEAEAGGKPRYQLGEEYSRDSGLWGMLDAGNHDPLLAAELNRGKDLQTQLGLAEPISMDEQLRRMERDFLERRGGAPDRAEELRAAGVWKQRLRGVPGGYSY